MRRLGVMAQMRSVIGYKDDPERKMGLVGLVDAPRRRRDWIELLRTEFCGLEGDLGFDDSERVVSAIACMNAFEPDLLNRCLKAARGLVSPTADGTVRELDAGEVLCITGERRSLGEDAARQAGMPVLFVGHRRCELWAVRYLAELARRETPDMEIVVVNEEEHLEKRQRDVV